MLTVRDIRSFAVGRCGYAPIVDHDGRMINDPVVLRVADDRYWFSIADSDIGLWAGGIAHGLGLDVEVSEPDIWPLAIQGRFADDTVAAVFGDEERAIKFFRFAPLRFAGHEVLVARSGWSAQGGFEIYVNDADVGGALYDALMAAGERYDIGPGCPNLIERIEAGLLTYGTDITRDDTALEAGLDRYCSLDADIDAIGIEALRRQAAHGVTRRIAGFMIDGDPVPSPRHPFPILVSGARVGQVTSTVWSPRLRTNVALGMLALDHVAPGTRVVVEASDGERGATVVEVPFPGSSQR